MKYLAIGPNVEIEFLTKIEADAYAAANVDYYCLSEQEYKERILAKKKREYGLYISNELVELMGARNKILGLTGAQVTALLQQLGGIKTLLETGALGTARTYMIQAKASLPYHGDVLDDGINDINVFEAENGL